MTETEARFDSLLAAIPDTALRVRIERRAMANSWADPALRDANPDVIWQAALATAEECISTAYKSTPELFQRGFRL